MGNTHALSAKVSISLKIYCIGTHSLQNYHVKTMLQRIRPLLPPWLSIIKMQVLNIQIADVKRLL